jgi:hypothetical protein
MIEVSITDMIVEIKYPSTISFVMLLTLRLRIARRNAPGMINKDGMTNTTLNSQEVFVRHKIK